VLAELLGRRKNIDVINSIRGEYGVLNCLCDSEEGASAGELCKKLHVVPGRMADILKSLEQKGLIVRAHAAGDRRVVKAMVTEKGREVSVVKRQEIREDYAGLFELLDENEVRELIRLLKIMLSFCPEE
jgi:DNA-binding MarR family transcriptional regulator